MPADAYSVLRGGRDGERKRAGARNGESYAAIRDTKHPCYIQHVVGAKKSDDDKQIVETRRNEECVQLARHDIPPCIPILARLMMNTEGPQLTVQS